MPVRLASRPALEGAQVRPAARAGAQCHWPTDPEVEWAAATFKLNTTVTVTRRRRRRQWQLGATGSSGPGPRPGAGGRDCSFKLPDHGHTIAPVHLACRASDPSSERRAEGAAPVALPRALQNNN